MVSLSVVMVPAGFEEAPLEGVGGGGGVAGAEPGAERGEQGLGRRAQATSRSTLRWPAERRVSAQNAPIEFGEALLDGHPAGVLADQRAGLDLVVVGDDDGGRRRGPVR